jgi:hypothetical protein
MNILKSLAIAATLIAALAPAKADSSVVSFETAVIACKTFEAAQQVDYAIEGVLLHSPNYVDARIIARQFGCEVWRRAPENSSRLVTRKDQSEFSHNARVCILSDYDVRPPSSVPKTKNTEDDINYCTWVVAPKSAVVEKVFRSE